MYWFSLNFFDVQLPMPNWTIKIERFWNHLQIYKKK